MRGIIHVGRRLIRGRIDIGGCETAPFQPRQHGFGIVAERDAEMIDQAEPPVPIDPGIERQFGVGRPAPHQRAARIVADAADHRGADARRSDHRMRFAPQRTQLRLELVQCRAGQAYRLPPVADQMDSRQPAQADDDHGPVIAAIGGRSAGQAGIGGLGDHDHAGRHAGLQDPPLFDQAAGLDHCEHRPLAKAEALAKAPRRPVARQQVAAADDPAQRLDQFGRVRRRGCDGGRHHGVSAHLSLSLHGHPPR